MNGQLDNLDCRQVTSTDIGILGQRYLREADSTRVGAIGGAEDLKCGNHGIRHVNRAIIRTVSAKSQVYKCQCLLVTAEPARLESDGAAGRGPVSAILRSSNTAA